MPRIDLRYWPIFTLLDQKFVENLHMVIVYGTTGNEALMVSKDDMVYALGSNIAGCLGTGDGQSTLFPEKVDALCEKGIISFAYGSGPHVLALTKSGKVYSWGFNCNSELGTGTTNQILSPTLVTGHLSQKIIVEIACGSHHSLALSSDGEVYAWGLNNHGQVGSVISSNQGMPRKVNTVLAGKKVVSIACGQTSSMAVTDNGEVYGWGSNGVGQLGSGNYVNLVSPCKVNNLTGVVIEKVVCGYAHTLALSDEGTLYVWGGNHFGQLGLGNKANACLPIKEKEIIKQLTHNEMGRVADVAALHYTHISVAMGQGGQIFIWGQCRGQSITSPMATPLMTMHDTLACYASPSVMHSPFVLYYEGETGILDCLKEAFDDPTTSDLVIQVQGKPIHVHKSVLKIRCQYFRSMFQEHWAENNQNVLDHNEFSYEAYTAFLKYLYTDEVHLPPENALELLDLANAYFETQLKQRCIQMIKQGITVLNATFIYKTAIEYNLKELEEFCFKFALKHMTDIVKSENFLKLDEITMKTFIVKAAESGAFKT